MTKTVFKNQGVNHWSNFSGLTPHPKGRHQPRFPGNEFSKLFLKNISWKRLFLEHVLEKYFQKSHVVQKLFFLGSGTFKISIASKRWCLRINSNFYNSHGDPNHEHFVKKHIILASAALRKICVFPSLGQLCMCFSCLGRFFLVFSFLGRLFSDFSMSRATFSLFVQHFFGDFPTNIFVSVSTFPSAFNNF